MDPRELKDHAYGYLEARLSHLTQQQQDRYATGCIDLVITADECAVIDLAEVLELLNLMLKMREFSYRAET